MKYSKEKARQNCRAFSHDCLFGTLKELDPVLKLRRHIEAITFGSMQFYVMIAIEKNSLIRKTPYNSLQIFSLMAKRISVKKKKHGYIPCFF